MPSPALAFTSGAVRIWVPVGAMIGIWLSWTLLAKRLRRYTIEADDVLTIPEFFEVRFGDQSGTLRTLTAVITIFFVVFYVSSGLVGGSKLLETIFGMEPNTGVVVTLWAVASYTLIGGFLAVSRTDVFQAILMVVSLAIMTGALTSGTESPFSGIGGSSAGFMNPFTNGDGTPINVTFVLSIAGWAFGAFGAQRSSGPHHQDSGEAKIRESTAGVSRKPSSDCKACGCSSKHLCGLTAWNT